MESAMRGSENARMNRPECADIRPLLVDHLRGESGRLHDVIARHLDGCEECREWMTFLRTIETAAGERETGGRLGFEKRLESVQRAAETRFDDRRAARSLVARVIGAAALFTALFGGLLPAVPDAARWLADGLTAYPLHVLAGTAGLLLLSSPLLLFTARRRMEDVS